MTHKTNTPDPNEPSWGSVDKTKLPRAAFLIQGEADKKSTWKFPVYWLRNGHLVLHRGGLRAALSAAAGGRSGVRNPEAMRKARALWERHIPKNDGDRSEMLNYLFTELSAEVSNMTTPEEAAAAKKESPQGGESAEHDPAEDLERLRQENEALKKRLAELEGAEAADKDKGVEKKKDEPEDEGALAADKKTKELEESVHALNKKLADFQNQLAQNDPAKGNPAPGGNGAKDRELSREEKGKLILAAIGIDRGLVSPNKQSDGKFAISPSWAGKVEG